MLREKNNMWAAALFIYFFNGGQQSVLMRNLKIVLLNQYHHLQGTFWTSVGVILLSQW